MQVILGPGGSGFLAEGGRLVGSDARKHWLAFMGQAYFGPEADRPVRVVGAVRDITQAKLAEATLRTSEERYRPRVEQLLAVVYVLVNDATQGPLDMSPKVEQILDQPVGLVLGRWGSWLERVHLDDRERVADWNEVWSDDGELFDARYGMLKAEGSADWVWGIRVPLRNEAGAVVAGHGILFDISADQALRRELVAAKDAAAASNRVKSTSLWTMSHEPRTPMGTIIGDTGLLLEDATHPLDAPRRADLEQIAANADRLLGPIDDALVLARIETPRANLVREPVDVARVMGDSRDEPGALAEVKGVTAVVDAPPRFPPVSADRDGLHQILLNLVGNAVKFTDSPSVEPAESVRSSKGRQSGSRSVTPGSGSPPTS